MTATVATPGPAAGSAAGSAAEATRGPRLPPAENGLLWLAAAAVPVALVLDRSVASIINLGGVPNWITTSTVVTFGLLPLWLPSMLRLRRGVELLGGATIFLVGGVLITWISTSDRTVQTNVAIATVVTLITSLFSVGALVWAFRRLGLPLGIMLFAGTMLFHVVTHPNSAIQANPWKFGYATPVAIVLLALTSRQRMVGLQLALLAVLGLTGVLNDFRSSFGFMLLTALILIWQQVRRGTVGRTSTGSFLVGLLLVVVTLYYLLERLLVSGLLGSGLAQRSEAQVEASGNLLLGGRPEWTVTIRLMQERPWGFGFGVQPGPQDIALGQDGFASIHLASQFGYLHNYVFNQIFRLHSITADLWVAGGFAGLLLAGVMVWILLGTLSDRLALRDATALQIYCTLFALWDIGFSPVFTAFPEVMLALAVALCSSRASDPLAVHSRHTRVLFHPGQTPAEVNR